MRRTVPPLALLLATLALAACGESDEDKAQTAVCDARAEISQQVDSLKALTPSTFTTEAAGDSLRSIRDALGDIGNAQADLSDDRREQVQSANDAFAAEVRTVLSQVLRSTSVEDAGQQLTTAVQQLASSYEQTFARIDCS